VPREDPRRWPGRQHAAPAVRRRQAAAVVHAATLAVRRHRRDQAAARRPRPAQPLPVEPWARAYGLLPAPGHGPHTVSLIDPGPGFDPQYAMTTDLDEPLIIATITSPAGVPARPLLIDGCHRLYKPAQLGREHLPSLVLPGRAATASAAGGPACLHAGGRVKPTTGDSPPLESGSP